MSTPLTIFVVYFPVPLVFLQYYFSSRVTREEQRGHVTGLYNYIILFSILLSILFLLHSISLPTFLLHTEHVVWLRSLL